MRPRKERQEVKASEVFVTSGTTTVPFLYPGCTADIEMRKTGSNETSYFTKLMIIEVTHEVDGRGYYDGRFEAIAADTGFIPRPEFEVPRAEAQFAKVISNTDPLNQGRVKIQFDWQNGPDSSEFIRVMTPMREAVIKSIKIEALWLFLRLEIRLL